MGASGRPDDGRSRRSAAVLAVAVVLSCRDGPTSAGASTTETTTTPALTDTGAPPGDAAEASTAPMTTGGAADETGEGSGANTTGAPAPLCESIALSVVFDPDAPVFGAGAVSVWGSFLDGVVAQTGAEVRVRLRIGQLQPLLHFCFAEDSAALDGDEVIWGRDFTPLPEARDLLGCYLAVAAEAEDQGAAGDAMFEGLMGPLLAEDGPPPPADLNAAMLVARTDDRKNDAVSRPGLAAEAFLRLGADGDRRRATAFAWGRDADELETFTLSIADSAAYYDRGTYSLNAALTEWQSELVAACAAHDASEPPRMPGGCEHLDILFVVDGSLSMAEEQAALRGTDGNPPVFTEFTDALVDSLDSLEDFHVGVISSQPGDVVLHRHRDQPEAPPVAINECPLPDDTNYIVGPTPTLAEQFACIAATAANTEETTAENAAAALVHPANAGFLRDDSVLLVVMLTDEDTQGFAIPRAEVHRAFLDAVGGDRARLVVLSIAGDAGTFEAPKTVCMGPYGGASPGRRLTSIVRTFRDRGLTQDICGGALATVFDAVLDDVIDTCMDFHPEG